MKKIILTGGGSAGHVVGNVALLPGLKERGYSIEYIGRHEGIEKEIIEKENIPYHGISTGKIHRFITPKNLTMPFKVIKGIFDAKKLLKEIKPDVIFSKGGFVSVPVAIASYSLKIPFIAHESDLSMGLANKLALKFTDKVLVTFPETLEKVKEKGILVGSPTRRELKLGDKNKGLEFLEFNEEKKVLLVMGGSLGSRYLNNIIRDNLDTLLKTYQICHLTGKGNCDPKFQNIKGYKQYEYVSKELPDIMHATDLIVSRAGSNAIYEYLMLNIPSLLIPLDLDQSRGDQIENAESFTKSGYSIMIREKDLNNESFKKKLEELEEKTQSLKENMKNSNFGSAVDKILDIIDNSTLSK